MDAIMQPIFIIDMFTNFILFSKKTYFKKKKKERKKERKLSSIREHLSAALNIFYLGNKNHAPRY